MTESTTDALLAPDALDLAHEEDRRKAQMDDEIADRRYALARIGQAMSKMKDTLAASGFHRRLSDDQFTGERSGMKIDTYYSGGEYAVRVTSPDINGGKTLTCRITLDLWERQPLCVDALTQALILIDQGDSHQIWLDSAGSLLGIEADVNDRGELGDATVLFGQRTPEAEADREEAMREAGDPSDGPPDMSGSSHNGDR